MSASFAKMTKVNEIILSKNMRILLSKDEIMTSKRIIF